MQVLFKNEKTVYDIAPYIEWDLSYKIWEQFPVDQMYVALGETIAHLEYLVAKHK